MKTDTNAAVGVAEPASTSSEPEDAALPAIMFVHPVPGFPGLSRFVLVGLHDAESASDGSDGSDGSDDFPDGAPPDSVLYELRSVEQPEIRFMVATAFAFFPDYDVELDDQVCENLDLVDAADALVLVILTVGADIASTTANLLAPVIVNGRNRSAAQVILSGSEWPVRAPLNA